MQAGERKFTVLGDLRLSQFFGGGTGDLTKVLCCFNCLSHLRAILMAVERDGYLPCTRHLYIPCKPFTF